MRYGEVSPRLAPGQRNYFTRLSAEANTCFIMFRFLLLCSFLLTTYLLSAQSDLVGRIRTSDGEALPGMEVLLKETGMRTVSDAEGIFVFRDLPSTHATLVIRSAFYRWEQKYPLPFPDTLDIRLDRKVSVDEVIVSATRVSELAPVSHTDLERPELERLNMGQDVPFILRWTPSMVVTSDAGTGIGYTYLRIRGSDQTRINVTINGIPLNDAESHQVFWVDLPDFIGSTDQVQIQRGIGSSTNGPGAFGATIHLNTNRVQPEAGGSVDIGGGSFGTWRARLEGHSGLLNHGYFVAARASRIHSDGFIDRARSDLSSAFFTAGRMTDRSFVKINVVTGKEETYQAWYGVPVQYIDDPELRTYNVAGTARPGSPHPDEVDFYRQTHIQAFYTRDMENDWVMNMAANYTRGKGYFELYRAASEDFIERRWLDNHFYGLAPSFKWNTEADPSSLVLGGGFFQYQGRHFGEALDLEGGLMDNLYENDGLKNDVNVYAKYNRQIGGAWKLWADMQYRWVGYDFVGLNRQGQPANQSVNLSFFNPKAGITWQPNSRWNAYLFGGVAHREPNRDDFTESSPDSRPRPERMINLEAGWRYADGPFQLDLNGYLMWYEDQLVQTGQLNDVGAATRVNVDESYRLGIEADARWTPSDRWMLAAALNVSDNRIVELVNYTDDWDTGAQLDRSQSGAPISYSPPYTGHLSLRYFFIGSMASPEKPHWSVESRTKFVGHQYLDNTGDPEARLDEYNFTELMLEGQVPLKKGRSLHLKFQVQNLFDQKVVSNGWIYRFRSESYDPVPDDPYALSEGNGRYQLRGLFPQAGIHWMASAGLRF